MIVLLSILGGMCLIFLSVFFKSYREYKLFKRQEEYLNEELSLAQKGLRTQERYLNLIKNDPNFIEWVARRRFGFVRSDDIVFKFETSSKDISCK